MSEDWSRLVSLGLTEDLLPVVSDRSVKISEQSKLKDIGKTPSRFNPRGEAVGIPQWTQHRTTERQVGGWALDSRLGICLQTRRVRAIDVDIGDPVHSAEVRDLVTMLAGTLPCRWRENSGKLLLAFWMPGEFTKRIIRTHHGIIEFLANGQQFIAHGTHTSGVRYQWDGLDFCEVLGGFPEMSPAEFDTLWQGLADVFGGGDSVAQRTGVLPSVPRSAADMHGDPVVAWLQENNWVREYDRDGRVHVRCPWEHEHTSDSGPTATSWFPAGVGGFHQGHFKCLHAHCATRTDAEFMDAIGYSESQFEVQVLEQAAGGGEALPWPVFTRDRAGRIESTATNAALALARPDIVGWRLGVDEFMGRRVIAAEGAGEWRPFRDSDYFVLRQALEARGFKNPGQDLVREAVRCVAEQHSFDSAINWAQALQWDGVLRVERFFETYLGVAPSAYSRAVGLYLWTALAGRCLEPGCKVDMVPVLIGEQGTGKTSMVEALAPTDEAFLEVNLEQRNEDQMARALRGKLVGEIAELRGLRTRDAEDIKAWITRRHEEIRALYAEFHTKYPRRLVMIGTGNQEEFLDDETGERRWLPLRVGRTDLEALRRDRDQLWAEGVVLWRQAGVRWRSAQDLAVHEHHAFKVQDPWSETIGRWFASGGIDGGPDANAQFSAHDVLISALRIPDERVTKRDEMRVARVLKQMGCVRVEVWEGGKNRKKWQRAKNSAFELC